MTIIYQGDCLEGLKNIPSASIDTCVTSPPYFGLRDYGHKGQIGLEPTPEEFVSSMVAVFREVHRVLKEDGTLWLNLGDSYARTGGTDKNISKTGKVGNTLKTIELIPNRKQKSPEGLKDKDLMGIPWRVAFALQADGWYLRQDIIWHKPNPMPESVKDRCTKAHEYIFLFSKSSSYYFDADAIKEPGKTTDREFRNRRSVWTIATRPYSGAHFATFPPDLILPCILAGAPEGGMVLDPFMGSGTTAMVARDNGRFGVGCELNPDYVELIRKRLGPENVYVQSPT